MLMLEKISIEQMVHMTEHSSLEADGEPTFQFGGMFQGTDAMEKRQNAEKKLTHDGDGNNVESKYVQAPLDIYFSR